MLTFLENFLVVRIKLVNNVFKAFPFLCRI